MRPNKDRLENIPGDVTIDWKCLQTRESVGYSNLDIRDNTSTMRSWGSDLIRDGGSEDCSSFAIVLEDISRKKHKTLINREKKPKTLVPF